MRGGTHEDDLGLVELLLDLHDGVGLARVLVLCEVGVDLGEGDGGGGGELAGGDLCDEVVEELCEEGEGGADGVLLVGDDDGWGWVSAWAAGRGRDGPASCPAPRL